MALSVVGAIVGVLGCALAISSGVTGRRYQLHPAEDRKGLFHDARWQSLANEVLGVARDRTSSSYAAQTSSGISCSI